MRTITGQTSDDCFLLTSETVTGALGPVLGFGGVYLALSGSVLPATRLLPAARTGQVTDRFDNGTFDGVELSGRLPAKRVRRFGCEKRETTAVYLGSDKLSEDMMNKDR